jgi:hypothetical protein
MELCRVILVLHELSVQLFQTTLTERKQGDCRGLSEGSLRYSCCRESAIDRMRLSRANSIT